MHDLLKRAAELANGMPPESFSIIHELIAEVERLRSENRELKKTDVWANDVIKEHESLNARINGLEAEAQEYHDKKEEALTLCAGQNRYIERLEAAFLEMYPLYSGKTEKDTQFALEEIRHGNKQ